MQISCMMKFAHEIIFMDNFMHLLQIHAHLMGKIPSSEDINNISTWSYTFNLLFITNLNLYIYASGKKLHLTHQDMQSTVT